MTAYLWLLYYWIPCALYIRWVWLGSIEGRTRCSAGVVPLWIALTMWSYWWGLLRFARVGP
jgi:hypothetical protein